MAGIFWQTAFALRHFAADTGTLHLLENDGLLHLKALSGQFPAFDRDISEK
jgi:hypothetical protein